jgi:hypothetical protein
LLPILKPIAPDQNGVYAPSIYHVPAAPGGEPTMLLYYAGSSNGESSTLLTAKLTKDAELTAGNREKLQISDGDGNVTSAQQTNPDRVYFVKTERNNGSGKVFLARNEDGEWKPTAKPILDVGPGSSWDSKSIDWISVLPPAAAGTDWLLWYIARTGAVARAGFASSRDGISWKKSVEPVIDPGYKETIDSVSVIPFAGGLRAWFVQREISTKVAQLLTVQIDPTDGRPLGIPEPVAWQSPKDWRLGLPKDNIPIVDARADPVGDDPRHIRLFITYKRPDGKKCITVAENFPINGLRMPTVCSRQVEPVLSPR